MGLRSEDIFNSLCVFPDDAKKYSLVLEKFQSYFKPKKNVIFKRALFNQHIQEGGESIDNFIISKCQIL